MPQDIDFHLPFPFQISADLKQAREHNFGWVRQMGLVTEDRALVWYTSWDMAKLAAYGYPYAKGPDLDLCADTMAFFFLFDDQFDGPLGRLPDRVARVCQELIDIIHSSHAEPEHTSPCAAAFADIWARSRQGMSVAWQARTAYEWEYYFATYTHEAIHRCMGVPQDMERFLHVRRGMSGNALPVSLGERASRIDVPAAAFHSPQLRIMRGIATDVTFSCNDVYSVEKEAARGDVDNIVLVLEHERQCSRAEAIEEVRRMVYEWSNRFVRLAGEVPALCETLALTPEEAASIRRYVYVMAAWIRGYHKWEAETRRYLTAHAVLPDTMPGYFEDLLTAPLAPRAGK